MAPTVFLTGANSGVGLASAKFFLEKGWNVAATVRNPDAAAELRALTSIQEGGTLLVLTLDMLKPETIQPAIDQALLKFGQVDVLVNNAGFAQYGVIEQLSMDAVRQQYEVNVFGPISLIKAFLPHFQASDRTGAAPVIVNVSSGGAHFGLPLSCLYNSSKAALNMFTECIQYELAAIKQPIAVKLVVPHGGIQSTSFGQNAFARIAPLETEPELAQKYGPFMQSTMAKFGKIGAQSMPVEMAAGKVFEAATDGRPKLRYFVASAAGGQQLRKRMEGAVGGESLDETDDRYNTFMRNFFQSP